MHIALLDFVFQRRAADLSVIPLKSKCFLDSLFLFLWELVLSLLHLCSFFFLRHTFWLSFCSYCIFLILFSPTFLFSLDLYYCHESRVLATGCICGVAHGKFHFQLQELSAVTSCNHTKYLKLLEILHLANAVIFCKNSSMQVLLHAAAQPQKHTRSPL